MDATASKHHGDGACDRLDGVSSRRLNRHKRDDDETRPLLGSGSEAEEPIRSPDDGLENRLEDRVLRKIDRTIIPLLFITYMLNFMDKTILSSAAVFGLPEDNVSTKNYPLQTLTNTLNSTSTANNTAGSAASSTSATSPGRTQPPSSSPASQQARTSPPTRSSGEPS